MSQINAIMDGEIVRIMYVNSDGNHINVTYLNNSNELQFKRKTYNYLVSAGTTFATSASIVN